MTDTPITDMVRKLLEKGVGHDALLIAIEAAEQAISSARRVESPVDRMDAAAEKRRAWDRERRRKERVASTGIHPSPVESPVDAENVSLSIDNITTTSFLEREAPTSRVHRTSRGERLPEDWMPTPQDQLTSGAVLGAEVLALELEKFRDHWKQQPGQRGVKLDWNAAWRNWTRRAAEYRGGRNGHGSSQNRADSAAGRAAAREVSFIAAVGRGAMQALKNGNGAGANGAVSAGSGSSEIDASERDATWADYEARLCSR